MDKEPKLITQMRAMADAMRALRGLSKADGLALRQRLLDADPWSDDDPLGALADIALECLPEDDSIALYPT